MLPASSVKSRIVPAGPGDAAPPGDVDAAGVGRSRVGSVCKGRRLALGAATSEPTTPITVTKSSAVAIEPTVITFHGVRLRAGAEGTQRSGFGRSTRDISRSSPCWRTGSFYITGPAAPRAFARAT